MSDIQLNLARKWRSQQFDRIVGQDLSIRILKNALFLGKFFPVYLFAGKHGCGKTTTARVFAAAANCERLADFQQNPKKFIVPCLQCDSCKAMLQGRHPDFIEMDAASHTGVDNVRQIIEASTLLPLLGRKKIYLIDEAHMLSKAAFNAFLKILEEPPASVFFILATTDEHKIIDTVRSRCFQLFFNAVDQQVLRDHLIHICQEEQIAYEPQGLDLIIKETGGSVRDALNLLEQVSFSAKRVGKEETLQVLGYIPEEKLYHLLITIVNAGSLAEVIQAVEDLNCVQYNIDFIWQRFLSLIHTVLWLKHGVVPQDYVCSPEPIQKQLSSISVSSLVLIFEFFSQHEMTFLKTVHKATFLQLFFVQVWHHIHGDSQVPALEHKEAEKLAVVAQKEKKAEYVKIIEESKKKELVVEVGPWALFLKEIDQLNEPLLSSIFKQAVLVAEDSGIHVRFAPRLCLFNDTLEQLKVKWRPLLIKAFNSEVELKISFDMIGQPESDVKKKVECPPVTPEVVHEQRLNFPRKNIVGGIKVDVSDKDHWPLTNKLLDYFPGTVIQLPEQKQEKIDE